MLRRQRRRRGPLFLDDLLGSYQPWLGSWMLQMALVVQPLISREDWLRCVEGTSFLKMVGLPLPEENEEGDHFETSRTLSKDVTRTRYRLKRQLQQLRGKVNDTDLPLFVNLRLLSEVLGLSEAEEAVLTFASALSLFPPFAEGMGEYGLAPQGRQLLARIMALLLDQDEQELLTAMRSDGVLQETGLVVVLDDGFQLTDKITLMSGMERILLQPGLTREGLMGHFLQPCSPNGLGLGDFPHLEKHGQMLVAYLGAAIRERRSGVNVFLHGPPGSGKTEFAKALAATLGCDLFESPCSDEEGEPLDDMGRLRRFSLSQRFLERSGNAMLLFDEVEDALPIASPLAFFSERMCRAGNVRARPGSTGCWRTIRHRPSGFPTAPGWTQPICVDSPIRWSSPRPQDRCGWWWPDVIWGSSSLKRDGCRGWSPTRP